jgi:hypothetical protein
MADEILRTASGFSINLSDALKSDEAKEKAIRDLVVFIDELEETRKNETKAFTEAAKRRNIEMKSCEEDVKRHLNKMLEETSLRLRADREIERLKKLLETSEALAEKRRKKIQEIEASLRSTRAVYEAAVRDIERMKKDINPKECSGEPERDAPTSV